MTFSFSLPASSKSVALKETIKRQWLGSRKPLLRFSHYFRTYTILHTGNKKSSTSHLSVVYIVKFLFVTFVTIGTRYLSKYLGCLTCT